MAFPARSQQTAPRLSEEQRIKFLKETKVTRSKQARGGITGTLRVTLSDGELVREASVQSIDESKSSYQTMMGTELNFRDSWKYNVAAYRLDRLLGMNMAPVSVERKHNGKSCSFTWWVDDVLMLEGDRLKKKLPPPGYRCMESTDGNGASLRSVDLQR